MNDLGTVSSKRAVNRVVQSNKPSLESFVFQEKLWLYNLFDLLLCTTILPRPVQVKTKPKFLDWIRIDTVVWHWRGLTSLKTCILVHFKLCRVSKALFYTYMLQCRKDVLTFRDHIVAKKIDEENGEKKLLLAQV